MSGRSSVGKLAERRRRSLHLTAAFLGSAVLLAPGPLLGQPSCHTHEWADVAGMRDSFEASRELRDSIEAILTEEQAPDSVGKVLAITDTAEMETDLAFVNFDPPKAAVYRIRGLLADHFADTPPEDRRVSVDLEAPAVEVGGDSVESCDPAATNDDHIQELLHRVATTYVDTTEEEIRDVHFRTRLWLFVDWKGEVRAVRVADSSGDSWIDDAAAAVGWEMEFEPATLDGTPQGVWVSRQVTLRIFR